MSNVKEIASTLSENDIKELQNRMFDTENPLSEQEFYLCSFAVISNLTNEKAKELYQMYLGEYGKVKHNLK